MPDSAQQPDGAVGLWVYAVVPEDSEVPGVTGVDDAPVRLVAHGSVAAAVSEVALDRPAGRRRELLAHTEVVNALADENAAVAPVQFGSILLDEQEVVQSLLEPRHDEHVDVLSWLRNRRQYNLRASYVGDVVLGEVVRDRPDVADLRARTRELPEGSPHPDLIRLGQLVASAMEGKREEDAADLRREASAFAVADHARSVGDLDVLDLALLVPHEQEEELVARLETLAEAVHERMHLSLTGPMAPYDFVGRPAWA